jgi:hypothetical protein
MRIAVRVFLPMVLSVASGVLAAPDAATTTPAATKTLAATTTPATTTPATTTPATTTPAAKTPPAANAPAAENNCLACHSESSLWEGDRLKFYITEKTLAADIHWQKGIRCVDCHGGDPSSLDFAVAHGAEANFHPAKTPADVPQLCGSCHANMEYMRHYQPSPRTDQLAEYWTSGHGRRLKATGDPQVATCLSCHGGKHNIKAVASLDSPVYRTHIAETCATCHGNEKIMAGREYQGRPLGHGQYEQWRQSVHGRAMMDKGDLSAATCNNCHGNHGALPPDIGSVANACGQCHTKVAKLFSETLMKHRFEKAGLPGCATCHFDGGTHLIRTPSDEMLGMTGTAVCKKCHEQGKYGATLAGADAARTMRSELDRLSGLINDTQAKLNQAARLGMEVSQPQFEMRTALSARTNARTIVHSFALKPMTEALGEGFRTTEQIAAKADAALYEYTARRKWLAGSLVPIFIVVILLLCYIRSLGIPAPRQGGEDSPEPS